MASPPSRYNGVFTVKAVLASLSAARRRVGRTSARRGTGKASLYAEGPAVCRHRRVDVVREPRGSVVPRLSQPAPGISSGRALPRDAAAMPKHAPSASPRQRTTPAEPHGTGFHRAGGWPSCELDSKPDRPGPPPVHASTRPRDFTCGFNQRGEERDGPSEDGRRVVRARPSSSSSSSSSFS